MDKKAKEGETKIIYKKSFIYSMLSGGVLLLAAAIVLIVLAASGVFSAKETVDLNVNNGISLEEPTDNIGNVIEEPQEPIVDTVNYVNPMDKVTVSAEQGFFYNATLDCFYEHVGMDLSATAGTAVYAVADGTIESVYSGDRLSGTQIVVDHGDGVKTVYGFVEPQEGLKAGDAVKQGQIIATVAEASGGEYKDGAHLHLEMYIDQKSVDPADYLTLSEK
jgi:murein DD-endopeptidase MepM/ murein hydrolase activator NlpD